MSKLKTYRVTAIQPVVTEALIPATSQKEAIRMAKVDELDCGTEIVWNDFDINDWYGYEAEECEAEECLINRIFKIRYRDTMTTYLLNESFKSADEAEAYIDTNLGESSTYEIEERNDDR